jgi:hypothetical protein
MKCDRGRKVTVAEVKRLGEVAGRTAVVRHDSKHLDDKTLSDQIQTFAQC